MQTEKTLKQSARYQFGKPVLLDFKERSKGREMGKTYKGLMEDVFSFDALYAAYIKARKGKRKKLSCLMFEGHLEENLITLQNQLIWGEYKIGGYRSFYVNEPKRRKITSLKRFGDRVVQHAINAVIEPLWEARFISDSYACRPGKGTHAGADKAQVTLNECLREHGKIYCLKADIRKYFASIDHEIVKRLLAKRIGDKRLLSVICDIVDSYQEDGQPGKGLPIGNLVSQLMANLYLDHLDQWLKCRRRVRWYVRYMDDFVIIHPNKSYLHALRLDIERFLWDELRLETNSKTSVFPVAHRNGRGLDFLGYHLWPDRRKLRKASLKRVKRKIRAIDERKPDFRDAALVKEQLSSWFAHAKHGEAMPALRKAVKSANSPVIRNLI